MTYGNIALGRMADSLDYHLAKRVRAESQWAEGTTADQYVQDVQTAVAHPSARILVYERSGDIFAATITPTGEIVPLERCGRDWQANLLAVYSALHAMVITGHMFSTLATVNLPGMVRWLR